MEPKTYTLATLLDMCGGTEDDVRDVLPWHDLREGGLWLSGRTYGLTGADLATMRWHPRKNSAAPVLPVPFTAFDLAAYFLAGGGLDLFQRFDFDALDAEALAKSGSDPSTPVVLSEGYRDELRDAARDAPGLLEDELRRLGENADEAREVLREALRLRRGADDRFGRTDEGVRKSADWLLNEAHRQSSADFIPRGKVSPASGGRGWWDIAGPYIVAAQTAGKFATAKDLYNALFTSVDSPDSPFDRGTDQHRGKLRVRSNGQPVALKTLQNKWADLRREASSP